MMNEQVSNYILAAPETQQKLMSEIRSIIHATIPSVIENFKWGRPVFSTKTDLAYFKTTKGYLTLGFFKFNAITSDTHLLEGTGKDMRHIKLKNVDDLQPGIIKRWLKQMTS